MEGGKLMGGRADGGNAEGAAVVKWPVMLPNFVDSDPQK
jgi:hypothetical protein